MHIRGVDTRQGVGTETKLFLISARLSWFVLTFFNVMKATDPDN